MGSGAVKDCSRLHTQHFKQLTAGIIRESQTTAAIPGHVLFYKREVPFMPVNALSRPCHGLAGLLANGPFH